MTETIDTAQPEALRLAHALDGAKLIDDSTEWAETLQAAAAELRRLQNALEMAVSDAQRSWRELAAAEARNATLTDDAARHGGLWAVNVHGPDDLYAMPSRAAALEHANELNVYFGEHTGKHEYDPIMRAVVIPWEHSAEAHAAAIKEKK